MSEKFEVELGVKLDTTDADTKFNSLKTSLENLKKDNTPIKITVDNSDAKTKLDSLKNEIKSLSDPKLNITNITTSLNKILSSVNKVQTSLGTLDKAGGMSSMLSSINEINKTISSTISKFQSLSNAMNSFKGINIDLSLGSNKTSVDKQRELGIVSRNTIEELKKQAKELESVFSEVTGVKDGISAVFKSTTGTNLSNSFWGATDKAFDAKASLQSQMDGLKEYINLMRELASIKGIDISGVTSGFSKSTEQLISDTNKILTGEKEMEQGMNQLKSIFGSGIDGEKVVSQLDTIITKLGEVTTVITNLSTNANFSGISNEVNILKDNITLLSQSLSNLALSNNALNGVTNSISSQASNISNQMAQAGTNAGNSFASGFNDGINITTNNASRAIGNMRKTLENMNFDKSSIGTITQDLQKMNLEISNVFTKMNGNNVQVTVKGIDELGRAVTIVKQFDAASGKILNVGKTISQSFETSEDKIKAKAKEVNDAFNQLTKLQGKINSKQFKLEGLDSASEEAKALKISLDELETSYNSLFNKYNGNFTNKQINKLNEIKAQGQMNLSEKSGKIIDTQNLNEAKAKAKETKISLDELKASAKKLANLEFKVNELDRLGGKTNEVEVLRTQLESLRETHDKLVSSFNLNNGNLTIGDISKLNAPFKELEFNLERLDAKIKDSEIKNANNLIGKFDNSYATDLEKLTVGLDKIKNKSTEVTKAMQQFNIATENMNLAKESGDVDKITASYEKYQSALKNANKEIKNNINAEVLTQKKTTLSSQIDVWLKDNSAAAKQFGSQIQALKTELSSCNNSTNFDRIKAGFQEVQRQAELAGKTTQTFGDRLKTQMSKLGTYFSAYMMISRAVQAMRDMYNNVHQVDIAMTELYRVTDLSSSQYNTLYDNMVSSAKEYGATLDGIISSTASWVRLGFNPNDANGLAEITSMYQHVTDLDESTAVNNLVTAYKGFEQQLLELNSGDKVASVEMITDVYDKLGNEFAISADMIGSGLSNAASTLQMAGNTFAQSAGMLTGITEITQDPEKAGNALKILSLRLRGMKGELEALGEDVDENVVSLSKMQTQVLNLTNGKVNIFNDDGSFKSTYEIMKGISEIYNSLEPTKQASLLETIAGKNRANDVASLINGWSQVEKATEAANNSAGTAREEQAKWMESMDGYISKLKSAWQTLSNNFLSSDFLKGTISGLTGFIGVLDKMVKTFGTIGTVGIGVGLGAFVKNFKELSTLGKSFATTGLFSGISETINLMKGIENISLSGKVGLFGVFGKTGELNAGITALKQVSIIMKTIDSDVAPLSKIGLAISGLSKSSQVAILGMTGLSEAEMAVALQAAGLDAELAATTAAEIAAGAGAAGAAGGFATLGASIAAAAKGMVVFLLTNPVGWAIMAGTAILGVVNVFKKLKQAQEEARESAQKDATSFSDSTKTIDDYVTKIQELRDKLSSGTLSEAEAYEAKKNLLEIQNELKQSYGDNAAGIDLLNGKIDEQIGKIRELSSAEAKEYLNKNSDVIKDAEKEMTKTLGGDGNWFAEAGETIGTFSDNMSDESKKIKEIVEKYKENIKLDDMGNGTMRIRFVGDATEAHEVLNNFMSDIRQAEDGMDNVDMLEGMFSGASDILSDADEIIEKYQDIYETAKQAQMIEESYGENKKTYEYGKKDESAIEWLHDYTEAINKYNEALLEGDSDKISSARSEFEAVDTAVQSLLKNEDFSQYSDMFTDIRDTLDESTISAKDFSDALSGNNISDATKSLKDYVEVLKESGTTDVQFKEALLSGIDGLDDSEVSQAIKNIVESYSELYNLNVSKMDIGQFESIADSLVQNGVLKKTENAVKATAEQIENFRTKLKDLNSEALEEFDKLSDEDKSNIVLKIDVEADDTKLWTLTKWKEEMQQISETGKSTGEQMQDFYNIMNDAGEGNLSEQLKGYIDKISSLQGLMSKIDMGTITDSEKVDMAINYPELAPYVNDTDALKNALQNLIDTSNQGMNDILQDKIDALAKTSPAAAEALRVLQEQMERLSNWNFNLDDEITKFDNLYSAMKESVSATGLSSQAMKNVKAMFEGLDGYDPSKLFERTYNGIHMNTTELRKLQAEYEKQKKSDITNHLQELKDEYGQLQKELSSCTDAQERASKLKELNDKQDEITQVADLAAQYEGLTSAYNKWIQAQSAGEEGELYDQIRNGAKGAKTLYDEGRVGTNAFRTYTDLLSSQDLSTATVDEVVAAYEKLGQTIQGTSYTAMDFLDEGSAGCENFLNAVQQTNKEWANFNKETGKWEINFGRGDDKKVADALGIDVEYAQSLLRKLSEYNFDINLDSIFSDMDKLGITTDQAVGKLNELKEAGKIDFEIPEFNLDVSSVEEAETEIKKAQDLLDNFRNEDGTVNIDAEGAEEAQALLIGLITKKQQLNAPDIMKVNVDTSNAQSDIESAIGKVQELQKSCNNLEVDSKVGVDTTEAQTNIQNVLTDINSIENKEVRAALGLDDTEFQTALTTLTSTPVDVKAGVNLDPTALETVQSTISAITPEMMVKAGLDSSLIDSYVPDDKDSTVKYNVDDSKVKSYTAPKKTGTVTYTASMNSWTAPTKYGTVVYTVKTQGSPSNGTANSFGIGLAKGTAFSQGSWGAKSSGVAFGGEVGQELVVRNGKFFTIGDDSAEFFQYKKDDIIFNAGQTAQIFKYGKIKNGRKRGEVFAQGNAFAEGTAFSSGSGSFTSGGSGSKRYSSSSSSNKKKSSSSNSSSKSSSSKKSSSSSEKDFEETFDWIEVAIDRIERAISRLDLKANSIYKSWTTRNNALTDQISKVNSEISLQQKAYDRYIKAAGAVGLSSAWKDKVKNGKIDINTVKDEKLADKIKEYQEWYVKMPFYLVTGGSISI